MAGGYFALVLAASVLLIAILLYAVALPLTQDASVSLSIPSISITWPETNTSSTASGTLSLPDTIANPRPFGAKEYRFCYLKNNKLNYIGGWKTIKEVLVVLGISEPVVDLTRTYKLKVKNYKN